MRYSYYSQILHQGWWVQFGVRKWLVRGRARQEDPALPLDQAIQSPAFFHNEFCPPAGCILAPGNLGEDWRIELGPPLGNGLGVAAPRNSIDSAALPSARSRPLAFSLGHQNGIRRMGPARRNSRDQ